MKRTLQAGIALVLAAMTAAPASAQTSVVPPAENGDLVVVSLRDDRELTGVVGKWVDDVGFYIKPAGSAAWLIHPQDIVNMRLANSGAMRTPPIRKPQSRMSAASKATIAACAVISGLFFLRYVALAGLAGG